MTIGDSRYIKRLVSKIIYSCELWQLTFLYGGSTLKMASIQEIMIKISVFSQAVYGT